MPIIIPSDIPAYGVLERERVFVMSSERAIKQDIRPIEIAILNLMPTKIETETQLIRLLSNTPLQVNITFIKTSTYKSTHTPVRHLDKFYVELNDIKERKFDGLIVTGAPLETIRYEEVKYWDELKEIMKYAEKNVTSTLFICWGALAGLYYHYGIDKVLLKEKLSGIYPHKRLVKNEPLLKGLDDIFYMPHSRYTSLDEKAVKACKQIEVLAGGGKAKSSIIKSKDGRQIFFLGHGEYDEDTLDNEYKRDIAKGINIKPPQNYYKGGKPCSKWKSASNLIFSNWLNHYVYQVTPYSI